MKTCVYSQCEEKDHDLYHKAVPKYNSGDALYFINL